MGKLVNIDNGGTLTDVVVIDAGAVSYTKTLTTPHDLSKCLFDGLDQVAHAVYGRAALGRLLREVDYIRYSTTQGTNALVERKGPRLGLVVDAADALAALAVTAAARDLIETLVGDRISVLAAGLEGAELETAALQAVNVLSSAGANRVVFSFSGARAAAREQWLERVLLRRFPAQLLGAVPLLFGTALVRDRDHARRTWTALGNAFLHPAMERFLYSSEHRLKEHKTRNPLLIFRNDGGAARVAKTMALKTYSSGPRGGMEGVRALAAHYGFDRVLSFDVGGTTTDVGVIEHDTVRAQRYGDVEGVTIAFPLCDIRSHGVGGSSILRVRDGRVHVGPDSVGAAPGPACFGLGGTEATMTDGFLLMGVLDPATFFGGKLALDARRARDAVQRNVAEPLGVPLDVALLAMEQAWVAEVRKAITAHGVVDADAVLTAFGGAGALAVTAIADTVGARRVLVPALAEVFSAVGIGFSDLSHEYEARLDEPTDTALAAALDTLGSRARRGMYAEGAAIEDCEVQAAVRWRRGEEEASAVIADGKLPAAARAGDDLVLTLAVTRALARPPLQALAGVEERPAVPAGSRETLDADGQRTAVPVYRLEDLRPGATAAGPAIFEKAFLTGRIGAGWTMQVTGNGDLLLRRDP
ncbi:MAG: hydantoinase/oxoprolinase family protein [Gammaproteobacteria bacterium]|nr:hydantoinase/oxoprolinase family protein [Gammaproteobacteria bacterium]